MPGSDCIFEVIYMKLIKKSAAALTALTLSAAILFSGCGSSPSTVSSDPTEASTGTTTPAETASTDGASSQPASAPDKGKISPLLWKVEGEKGNTLYLFGTIHVGDERSKQVAEKLSGKIKASDALAVEFDSKAYESDTALQTQTSMSFVLKDGTTIKDHMRADLYDKSVEYLTGAGLYSPLYETLNLGFWETTLNQVAIQKSPFSADYGMDSLLIDAAYSDSKEILELESAQFQIDMICGFPDEVQNLLIESFFETESEYSDELSKLYKAWLVGDEAQLQTLLNGEDEDDEELTPEQQKLMDDYSKTMIDDRNNGMSKKADEYLKSGKNVFFTAGTAHMIGDKGIVKQLTDKGYKVEKVEIE